MRQPLPTRTALLPQPKAKTFAAAAAMLFDCYNPWAKLIQLNSTHPLTGLRIQHLGEIAAANGQGFADYDIAAAAQRVQLSRAKLRGQFLAEFMLLLAPIALGLLVGVLGGWPIVPAAIAVGVLATLPLRYPLRAPTAATVMALMGDPAASPVRGQPVRLEGKAIGRANAGFIAGEDMIFQDRTGLMTVDFRSMLGLLGNLFAGWRRVPKHMQQQGEAIGWFRRSMGGYLILKELNTSAGRLRAKPFFWQVLLSLIVIVGNVVLLTGV